MSNSEELIQLFLTSVIAVIMVAMVIQLYFNIELVDTASQIIELIFYVFLFVFVGSLAQEIANEFFSG